MKIGSLALKLIVAHLKHGDKKPRKDWPKDGDFERKCDIDALGDGRFDHQFDIVYAPKEKRLGRTLIDIHGGAYVYSYRKNNFGFASVFAARGYDVVLLDYPHNNKKHGVHDQIRVLAKQLAFLVEHASEYGLEGNEFGLIGDSAGGHMALLLAEASCDKELEQKLGIDLKGVQFVGVAVSSPVYDFLAAVNAPVMSNSGRKMMFGPDYRNREGMALLSPKEHIDSLRLPVFLNSCKHDFIGEHSFDMHRDLTERNHPLEWCFIDAEDKNVDHVHNVTKITLPESVQVNNGIMAFFDPLFH